MFLTITASSYPSTSSKVLLNISSGSSSYPEKNSLYALTTLLGVGCEKFAEYTYNFVNEYISSETSGRVKLISVEVFEHGANSAVFKNI